MRELPMITDADLAGKRVLLRLDLNVTFVPGTTRIADDSRVHASVPTIEALIGKGAAVILCSHLGRPKGRVVPEMQIEPVRQRTAEILGRVVSYLGGPSGDAARLAANQLTSGDIGILENLRFHPGEEANDEAFAKELASYADVFVNDAFGASHRSHASTSGVATHLPAYAGLLMQSEIQALQRAVDSDEHPAVAILGGSKVADKLDVVTNLARSVDAILIGGGMISAILAAQGRQTGSTEVGQSEIEAAQRLLSNAAVANKLRLPLDVVLAEEFSEKSSALEIHVDELGDSGFILDIGSQTIAKYVEIIGSAQKIIWNGPMGLFEWSAFSQGTRAISEAISANVSAFKLAGGGSTVEAIQAFDIADRLTHVSTGGGASLEFLEGKELPGVSALARGI